MADRQPVKVDAPGERARRFATVENAAPWIAALVDLHQPKAVTVEELGGWAAFEVSRDETGDLRFSGKFTWTHTAKIGQAAGVIEDA